MTTLLLLVFSLNLLAVKKLRIHAAKTAEGCLYVHPYLKLKWRYIEVDHDLFFSIESFEEHWAQQQVTVGPRPGERSLWHTAADIYYISFLGQTSSSPCRAIDSGPWPFDARHPLSLPLSLFPLSCHSPAALTKSKKGHNTPEEDYEPKKVNMCTTKYWTHVKVNKSYLNKIDQIVPDLRKNNLRT